MHYLNLKSQKIKWLTPFPTRNLPPFCSKNFVILSQKLGKILSVQSSWIPFFRNSFFSKPHLYQSLCRSLSKNKTKWPIATTIPMNLVYKGSFISPSTWRTPRSCLPFLSPYNYDLQVLRALLPLGLSHRSVQGTSRYTPTEEWNQAKSLEWNISAIDWLIPLWWSPIPCICVLF